MSDLTGQLGFVSDHMPIIRGIGRRFAAGRPFDGLTVAVRIHVEPKTAVLLRTLRDGGARVIALGNKGTTNDELAELLLQFRRFLTSDFGFELHDGLVEIAEAPRFSLVAQPLHNRVVDPLSADTGFAAVGQHIGKGFTLLEQHPAESLAQSAGLQGLLSVRIIRRDPFRELSSLRLLPVQRLVSTPTLAPRVSPEAPLVIS